MNETARLVFDSVRRKWESFYPTLRYFRRMDRTALREEIARNFDAFQRTLATILPMQEDRYALLRHGAVVAFFDRPGPADLAGASQFADGLYSIQQVTAEPVELGMYANAPD